MSEDLLLIGRWLIDYIVKLWQFLGAAHFLGFAVIGIFVIRKICGVFRALLSNK